MNIQSPSRKSAKGTLLLALGALGVVYGDIGTSPIYAFKESVNAAGASRDDVLGIVSLIFWTLTIVVSIKYLLVVLRADNHGEGGVLALFALLPQRIREARKGPKAAIVFMMLLAASLLFADGLLTPAISVLSATEGLGTINPDLAQFAVPATVVILLILFIFQFRGTGFMGTIFGPIMMLWFISIALFGISQLVQNPEAFIGLNPAFAIEYIGNHGWFTLIVMSSVILAVTGAEALYADLGHFGKSPIRISWFAVVNISLVLSYLGQAALVLRKPEMAENPFFGLAPNEGWVIYLVLLSTVATIIASQALISGVASIASQAIRLGLIARMKVVHTSHKHEGQIYVPFVNAIVGIGAIALVIIFETSSALAGAYAFAIAGTMMITTIALFWIALENWKWRPYLAIPLLSVFLVIDVAFVVSTSTKIFKDAWVPLLIGFVVASIMWIWRKGRYLLNEMLTNETMTWNKVDQLRSSKKISVTPSVGIYLAANPSLVPQALESQIRALKSMPQKIVMVHVVTTEQPYSKEKPLYIELSEYLARVTVFSGFMELTDLPKALRSKHIREHFDEKEATYFVATRKFVNPHDGDLNKVEDLIFSAMHRNSESASEYFKLPAGRVITISVSMED
ncbi:potassium transporter Kup [Aurantimicrobium minutum]|uniref:potassium transporter Kup n=1 Tax=Aurantimicrobium minutum TaxID=708131 RepID=UPI0024743C96|nr:KUP/HAK/KT family potassium transporter [Aurantimicrobium minutum]MDH6423421.1 KUP system potassium uptake protein [Aurantimicrobium minutum]